MHNPEEAPSLNPWPFIIGDVVLIATACFIASDAETPLTGAPLLSIVACVVFGAILAAIPFLLNHSRSLDASLLEKQRQLAALAKLLAASTEQLATATASLSSLAEDMNRSARLVEPLPHRLQEKINEFKAQLNEVAVTENEALSQEINTLRAGETERLETALTGVRKAAAELSALEASVRKQFKELNEALSAAAPAAEKSATQVVKAIEQARAESEKALASAQSSAVNALKQSLEDVLAEIRQATASRPESQPDFSNTQLPATPNTPVAEPVSEPEPVVPAVAEAAAAPAPLPETKPEAIASSPEPLASPALESAPAPVATAEPLISTQSEPAAEDVPPMAADKPARKRPVRKTSGQDAELSLGLDLPSEPVAEFSQIQPEPSESAVSADGVTRLLVTAYIGIGNKLFVRGEGPGLSWDRGVPLQFVSIGKWRWETAEAEAPVKVKLYKNDEVECVPVGLVSIAPGHQQEVSASFS